MFHGLILVSRSPANVHLLLSSGSRICNKAVRFRYEIGVFVLPLAPRLEAPGNGEGRSFSSPPLVVPISLYRSIRIFSTIS